MKIERYVLELPDYPVLSKSAAAAVVEEIVKMTAEANTGLDRDTLLHLTREHDIRLSDLELYVNRLLTMLYNTKIFSTVVKICHPLAAIDVEIVRRTAMVEITWNDRANKNHA